MGEKDGVHTITIVAGLSVSARGVVLIVRVPVVRRRRGRRRSTRAVRDSAELVITLQKEEQHIVSFRTYIGKDGMTPRRK